MTIIADPTTSEAVVSRAEAAGIRLVRFLYCDNDGIIRGKTTSVARLRERLHTGVGLSVAMLAFTLLDQLVPVEEMGAVGEIRLVPAPETFSILPYVPATASLIADMETPEGNPFAADGRYFLKRMIERARHLDLDLMAAFEPEWSLARPEDGSWIPADRSGCFTTAGMNAAAPVIDEIFVALEAQGLEVEQYYPELGWGQQELSIAPASALSAADNHLLYRETVRGVAFRHGLCASFAPKPWPEQPGNGCHLHLSGWNLEHNVNRFHNPTHPHGLSPLGSQFLAGILHHLPGLLALTCASINSYRRLQPQTWASAYTAWGPDNREAAVRVPSVFRGRESKSFNFEFRASDSTANPYLALGGVIAAGLDGIERSLELPEPAMVDPHTLNEEERQRCGIARYPQDLSTALDNLQADPILAEAMGEKLLHSYTAVKQADLAAFGAENESFEFHQHFDKF